MMIGDFFGSFYSHHFYADVAHDRKGIGASLAVLLTLVMILCAAPWNIYPGLVEVMDGLQKAADDMPALTLQDDKLSIDKKSPYYIPIGTKKDKLSIVIDTDYRINDLDKLANFMKEKNIVMLITSDRIATLKDRERNHLDIVKLAPVSHPVTITHDQWKQWVNGMDKWGAPAVFTLLGILVFVILFAVNMLISLLVGIIVKIVSLVFGADLDYSGSVRIATAFRIPSYVIASLPLIAGYPRLEGFGAWAIWCIYLLIAVHSSKYN